MPPASTVVDLVSPDGKETKPFKVDDLNQMFANGWRPVNEHEKVRVVTDGGERITTLRDLRSVQTSGIGADVRSKESIDRQQLEQHMRDEEAKRFSGPLHTLSSAAMGFGDFITLNATKAARRGLGVDKEWEEAQIRNNSTANKIGMGAGVAASIFLPGGQAGLAKGGAQAAVGATRLARASSFIPAVAATRLGSAAKAGMAARGAGAIRQLGVAGAVEGATIGAAYNVADVIAGDKEFSAEALLSSAGSGALYGGAIGGGLGVAGGFASRIADKAAKRVTNKALQFSDDIVLGTQQHSQMVLSKIDDIVEKEGRGFIATNSGMDLAGGNLAGPMRKAVAAADEAKAAVNRMMSKVDDLADLSPKQATKLAQNVDSYVKAAKDVAGIGGSKDALAALDDLGGVAGDGFRSALGKQTGKGKGLMDAGALLEMAGVTDFVPDNPITNAVMGAWAVGRLGQHAGKLGKGGAQSALSQYLGGGVIGKSAGGILGKAGQAIVSTKDKIANGVRAFATKGAQLVNKTQKAHTKTAMAALEHSSFSLDPITKEKVKGKSSFERVRAELESAKSNPNRTMDMVSASMGDLAVLDGNLANRIGQGAMKRIDFLFEKLPPQRDSILPTRKKHPASRHQIAKFARYVKAAEEPLSVLDDMQRGKLTKEAVETIQALYPRMYAEVVQEFGKHMEKHGESMPYRKKVQMSILLGVPADDTLRPEFIRAMQSKFEVPQEGGGSVTQDARAAKNITMGTTPTNTQRLGG